jgi:hypothetical protein
MDNGNARKAALILFQQYDETMAREVSRQTEMYDRMNDLYDDEGNGKFMTQLARVEDVVKASLRGVLIEDQNVEWSREDLEFISMPLDKELVDASMHILEDVFWAFDAYRSSYRIISKVLSREDMYALTSSIKRVRERVSTIHQKELVW